MLEKSRRQKLHEKCLRVAENYRRSESDLIDVLQENDSCQLYRDYDCTSLFEYATRILGLSESVAYNLITIARKSKEVPELKEAIRSGKVTSSKARKITPVITAENKNEWLKKAEELPQPKLEKAVAQVRPQELTPERMKYVSETRIKLELGVSEKLMEQLCHIQDLESQRTMGASSLEDCLEAMVGLYLERNDPLVKAKRAAERAEKRNQGDSRPGVPEAPMTKAIAQNNANAPVCRQVTDCEKSEGAANDNASDNNDFIEPVSTQDQIAERTPIPAHLKHQVYSRDGGHCSYQSGTGHRCQNKRWLDIHHVIPVAQGGENTLENLLLLCRYHHSWVHEDRA